MSSFFETRPVWEQTICNGTALSVDNLGLEPQKNSHADSFSQVTASLPSSDSAQSENVAKQLIAINEASITSIEDTTKKFIDTVGFLQNTQPDEQVWSQAVDAAYQTAMKSYDDRLHAARDEAIDIIKALPEAQRPAAANLYETGSQIVVRLLSQTIPAIRSMSGSVKEFSMGNWTKLAEVWDAVQGWCSNGLKALDSMFGFSDFGSGDSAT